MPFHINRTPYSVPAPGVYPASVKVVEPEEHLTWGERAKFTFELTGHTQENGERGGVGNDVMHRKDDHRLDVARDKAQAPSLSLFKCEGPGRVVSRDRPSQRLRITLGHKSPNRRRRPFRAPETQFLAIVFI